MQDSPSQFDAVTLEVLWTRLISTVDEAAKALRRTSFSTLVNESNDFACVVTDADGDVINLVWEQTHVPAPTGVAKTKGTYLSGTGKYEGIQGYYTFSCKLGGIVCNITAGDYRIP